MRFLLVFFLTLGILSVSSFPVFAQDEASSAAAIEKPQPSTYTLPYPGMLPDNPLYPLKMLRDRIVLFLISDPVKKAEFNLLQADKRLQAGVYLWNEKPEKVELVISTISKGENYFEQAISDTRLAIREGRETDQIRGDLERAAIKHGEVLQMLQEEMPQESQEEVTALYERMEGFAKSVVLLK